MLFLLIISLATGSIGGALIPTRIITIALTPFLSRKDLFNYKAKSLVWFFTAWLSFCVISLIWTSDTNQGLKELVYYPIHMLFFLELICFSRKAKNPLRTITNAWIITLTCTSIIAIWELTTGNHLSISKWDEDTINYDGILVNHSFASVTFGNYNGYVVFLIYALPYLLYRLVSYPTKIIKIICMVLLGTTCYTLFMNSSRGGLLSMLIIFLTFIFMGSKLRDKTLQRSFYFLSFLIVFIIYKYWDVLSFYLSIRTSGMSSSTDDVRWSIWSNAFICLIDSNFIGTGVGSVIESMRKVAATGNVIVPHNLFIEFAVQYGVIFFIVFIVFLLKTFRRSLKSSNIQEKMLLMSQFLALPVVSLIDSSYLLNPATWCFFACIYIFSNNENLPYFNTRI